MENKFLIYNIYTTLCIGKYSNTVCVNARCLQTFPQNNPVGDITVQIVDGWHLNTDTEHKGLKGQSAPFPAWKTCFTNGSNNFQTEIDMFALFSH